MAEHHASLEEIMAMAERTFQHEFNPRLFAEQLLFMDEVRDYDIDFFKIPMAGGPPQMFLQGRGLGESNTGFGWLPDGNIVWASTSSGDGHLVNRDLQSGEDREITSGIARERYHAR